MIVEGKGDILAGASLLSKVFAKFKIDAMVAGDPIRAGEARKLNRAGELERFSILAAGHQDIDEIFILLDLDDDCARDWQDVFRRRAESAVSGLNKTVKLCFCVREFECWFLACITHLSTTLPDYRINPEARFPDSESIRGAKEQLSKACAGRKYKPMRDQNFFVKQLDIANAFNNSRSFQKFVKEATGLPYERIRELLN
jgi:hypothetical protein